MVMLLSFCDLITEATPVLSQPGVWHLNFSACPGHIPPSRWEVASAPYLPTPDFHTGG